ncbi:hypothetical protein WOLCODRAFT_141822 [Wolfiporia cocos MD-104 SS10]|uniref:Uncharacterized protein n=1 Tax=Wolfiporia cocos (strain MD-104) TaxID=742152 RepID=A0A2H3JAY1_WOLCO|nr:hypothetical protein WOLCODRAFT_141822 [Wolfiporia cocos MD-104 SS10]
MDTALPGITVDALLNEVHTESLQNVLVAVRRHTSGIGDVNIPALDEHLSSHLSASFPAKSSMNRGDVIEIQGPPASGKSQLLHHLLIGCITPTHYGSTAIYGWDKAAVLFDTDGTFDAERFNRLLVSRLSRMIGIQNQSDVPGAFVQPASFPIEKLASRCLARLHVFRPDSSYQLAATLMHLPRYHATHSSLRSAEIGLVAIDSMSAFHWTDRFTMEQLRGAHEATGAAKNSAAESLAPLQCVMMALQALRASHGPVIAFTNWGLHPMTNSAPTGEPASQFYRQHLHPYPAAFERPLATSASPALRSVAVPPATSLHSPEAEFQQLQSAAVDRLLLTHHITLHPLHVEAFPARFGLGDVKREDSLRCHLVQRGEIHGFIRTPGTADIGKFSFFINDEDILAETPSVI